MIWYIKDNGLDVVAEPPRINLPPPPWEVTTVSTLAGTRKNNFCDVYCSTIHANHYNALIGVMFKQQSTFCVFTQPQLNTRRVGRIRDSYANPSRTLPPLRVFRQDYVNTGKVLYCVYKIIFTIGVNLKRHNRVYILGSLSTRVFETRTATGREHFACQESTVSQISILLVSNGEKILSNVNVAV